MKQERYAEVLAESEGQRFKVALPAEGIGLMMAALRLLSMHTEYIDLSHEMRRIVVHYRIVCRVTMVRMGFSKKEIDTLDAEVKPDFRIKQERLVEVYEAQEDRRFVLHISGIDATILHGALMLLHSHPDGRGGSQAYEDLIRAIRDVFLACYTHMGFTGQEASYLDTTFTDNSVIMSIRSHKPMYYTHEMYNDKRND